LLLQRRPRGEHRAVRQIPVGADIGARPPQVVEAAEQVHVGGAVGPVVQAALGLVRGEEQARLEPRAEAASDLESQSRAAPVVELVVVAGDPRPVRRNVVPVVAVSHRPHRAAPTPRRVKICTTPVTASEPYSTLAGPRSTSMRSTLSVVRCAKSKAPPGSFTGTPSTSTFTYLLWPPRRNSEVTPPKEPVWT